MITIYHKGMVVCMGEPSQKDAELVALVQYAAQKFQQENGK